MQTIMLVMCKGSGSLRSEIEKDARGLLDHDLKLARLRKKFTRTGGTDIVSTTKDVPGRLNIIWSPETSILTARSMSKKDAFTILQVFMMYLNKHWKKRIKLMQIISV